MPVEGPLVRIRSAPAVSQMRTCCCARSSRPPMAQVLFVSTGEPGPRILAGARAHDPSGVADRVSDRIVGPSDQRGGRARPEYTVRFKWNAGDIAFWDNRSTSHLAPTDIFQSDFDRQLYRITLVGQPLVGVDGRPSTAIEGVPILSAAEELRMMSAAE